MLRRGLAEWVAGVVGDAIVVEKAAVVGKIKRCFQNGAYYGTHF